MINANEYRIGNKVLYSFGDSKDVVGEVTGIYKTEDEEKKLVIDYHYPGICSKPIPLTPEVLGKCGFSKVGQGNFYSYRISINLSDELVWYSQDNILRYQTKGNGFTRDYNITFLHQLQNLYFALTGHDLPITNLNANK